MTTAARQGRAATGQGARKLVFIEAVRGTASLLVLLHHVVAAQVPAFEEWTRTYVDPGRVGVVAFFVVSGYVIPMSMRGQTAGVFVRRRVFRLFPVYWVALGAFLLAAPLVAAPGEAMSGPLVLIANVFMIQGLLPLATAVPTAWTLGIELVFYAQSLAGRWLTLLSRPAVTGAVWLVLFGLAQTVKAVTGVNVPVTVFVLLFTASLGHALFERDSRGATSWRWLTAAAVMLVPALTILGGDVDPEWSARVYLTSYLGGMALWFVFDVFRARLSHGCVVRVLTALGAWSYALYLFHPLVYRLAAPALPVGFGVVGVVLVTFVLSLTVSALVHVAVERPMIAWARSKRPR